MTQSPCRHCPHRHQDKNRCLETCELIKRLQTYQIQHRDDAPFSAVDAADEGRYRIMAIFDVNRLGVSGLPV